MRMHFRPRLASYYKAGAAFLGVIDHFYLCDFEALLLTRAGNRAAPTVGVVVELYPCSCQARQTSRRGASAGNIKPLSSSQVEVVLVGAKRETEADRCARRVPGRSQRARMARQGGISCGYARSNSGRPSLGRGLPAVVGAGRAPAGCHVQALTIDRGRERRPTKYHKPHQCDGCPHVPRRDY